MTDLTSIQESLVATNARLLELNRAIAQNPDERALVSMTRSVQHRQQSLEREFLAAAAAVGIDVCSYRVFASDENEIPKLATVTRVLDAFQTLVSTVYSAVRDGVPRSLGRLSAQAIAESSFGLGYVYQGSVGVVLTVANQPNLFDEAKLDETVQTVFAMARATTPTQLQAFSERLGSASVRALLRWSRSHNAWEVGADIEWRRAQNVRTQLLIQLPEISQLIAVIEAASEETRETDELSVMLLGIDAEDRSFHLRTDTGTEIRGSVSREIVLIVDPATVPKRYTVALTRVVRTHYSLDQDQESWEIEGLTPVDA